MAHRLAPEARADLVELWSYVADERNIETADRLVDSITARSSCCQDILASAGGVTTYGPAFTPFRSATMSCCIESKAMTW
jgi:hypothetical protein